MSARPSASGQFTGRHMLAIMLAFFGVIIAVNVTMAVFANTSWTGFVVRNSYVAGLDFNRKTEQARRQAALGWTSEIAVADGALRFALTDADGKAVPLHRGEVTLRRPVSDAEDVTVALLPGPGGALVARLDIRDGSWIATVSADAGRDAPWREATRFLLRGGRTR